MPARRHDVPVPTDVHADRRRTPGAAAVAVLVALGLAGQLLAVLVNAHHHTQRTNEIVGTVANGVTLAVGAVVALSVPGNVIGWLILGAGVLTGVAAGVTDAGVNGVLDHPSSTVAGYAVLVGVTLRALPSLLLIGAVPAYFPDGRLPGPRWRWLRWVLIAAVVAMVAGGVLAPIETRLGDHWHGPLTPAGKLGDSLQTLDVLGVLLTAVAGAGAVAGLVHRWRRGGAIVRQQLLLFACAALVTLLFLVSVLVIVSTTASGGAPRFVFALAELPLPVAVAAATLNHGLYDLRRAANRTILWLIMSATIAALYVVVVVTVTAIAPGRTSWWPPALAATAAAVALGPVRNRLERVANRVVYGRWREPYEVLSGLAERLEAAADVDRLLDAAVTELAAELDLRELSVRDIDGAVIAGSAGRAEQRVPLQAYGSTVGWLGYRNPDRELSDAEQRLIRDLARHLGATLHARALLNDLQHTRERLVVAREEERRRLRRDLHDGIGPALAGLTLKAETARTLLPPEAELADRHLRDLSEEIRATVIDVRRLVEGLRPPALDDLGLDGAVQQTVRRLTDASPITASVHTEGDLASLPAAVEVAAFRIVQEAVTNVVRHARATRCEVRLRGEDGVVQITVADDGTGLRTDHAAGNGLATMRERADELGGTFLVVSRESGVDVRASLPTRTQPARNSAGV